MFCASYSYIPQGSLRQQLVYPFNAHTVGGARGGFTLHNDVLSPMNDAPADDEEQEGCNLIYACVYCS